MERIDMWLFERDKRQEADQRSIDFQLVAERWCAEARRERKAFLIASAVAVVMALTAIAGWAR